ncbi:MAG: putative DNA binding domain-containing protein [Acidobacteriota bacterium]|nr:putative DNA binding domain-containing protein [Acidobacteriota bacterium]
MNQPAPQTSRNELLRLIRGGEDTYLELKIKLSNPERIAQEIVALANTAGGIMVFGVTDQLRIEGVDYAEDVQDELARICRDEIYPPLVPLIDMVYFDSGRRVVVLEIEGKRRPYRTRDGRFYLRIGTEKREASREELSMFLEEIRPLGYENIPVIGAQESDIDDALLWSFAKAFEDDANGRFTYNTAEFLKRDLLLAVGNTDEFIPTVAAVLLFGKNERVAELLPRSTVTAIRYSGETTAAPVVEKAELKGNLLTLFESSVSFVKRYGDLWNEKPRIKSDNGFSPILARANYSQSVIYEAIVNALAHRDLALRDSQTRILIFDNSIEIINPRRTGGFVPPASRAIRYGITQRLNPQIAAIFSNPAYEANLTKSSLPQLLRQAREFSGKRPEIYTSGDEFRLKIYGK